MEFIADLGRSDPRLAEALFDLLNELELAQAERQANAGNGERIR